MTEHSVSHISEHHILNGRYMICVMKLCNNSEPLLDEKEELVRRRVVTSRYCYSDLSIKNMAQ